MFDGSTKLLKPLQKICRVFSRMPTKLICWTMLMSPGLISKFAAMMVSIVGPVERPSGLGTPYDFSDLDMTELEVSNPEVFSWTDYFSLNFLSKLPDCPCKIGIRWDGGIVSLRPGHTKETKISSKTYLNWNNEFATRHSEGDQITKQKLRKLAVSLATAPKTWWF